MIKVGLLGLGTVGSGVYESFQHKQALFAALFGEEVRVVSVLVKDETKNRGEHTSETLITTSFTAFLAQSPDVVFEAIGGIEPAYTYLRHCLESKIPVISANKALIARHGEQLHQLARQSGTYLAYEASVAGGIPVLHSLKHQLQINRVFRLTGILNGTTNYILSRMTAERLPFEQALLEAQTLGYAEADPTDDVDGWDALYKLQILAYLVTQSWSVGSSFSRRGIRDVQAWQIQLARKLGMSVKLLASLAIDDRQVDGSVEPIFLPQKHPLAGIHGVTNALTIQGDLVGELTFQGPGAGKLPTASAMIEDFAYYHPLWQQRKGNLLPQGLFAQDDAAECRQQGLLHRTQNAERDRNGYRPGQSVWLVYEGAHPLAKRMDELLPERSIVSLFSYDLHGRNARLVQMPSNGSDWRTVLQKWQIDWFGAWIDEDEWSRLAELESEWQSRKARPTAFAI